MTVSSHLAGAAQLTTPSIPSPPSEKNGLDGDSLAYLFSFLDLEDLPTLPQVCKQWATVVKKNANLQNHIESLLPARIKQLQNVSLQEKTKIYIKELDTRVNFVLNNPDLKIHVYLWSPEGGAPLFPTSLIEELKSDHSLSWKAEKISNVVNQATFFNQPEKIACYKFTHLANDKDIEEANHLLAAGFDPNLSLSEKHADKYPTALFTLVDMGMSYMTLNRDSIVQLIKNMIDHGLDVSVEDKKGKTALELLERNPRFPVEEVSALTNYAESKRSLITPALRSQLLGTGNRA
ncbi:F-box protein [Estrella lausannensis]|uniref:F-box domain-containing protein n=1 Tax=Estrella lausannensis TaxID=483423 RepID=A0A0H5DQN0_9BACT|nr:F-box protein [Estrella lausannensis]CRX38966.1 hypothetical protein ELAC_1638 [Estrella lausannensis]